MFAQCVSYSDLFRKIILQGDYSKIELMQVEFQDFKVEFQPSHDDDDDFQVSVLEL